MRKLLILLAAGLSRRFGPENKLLYDWNGVPLYRNALDKLAALRDAETDVLVMTNTAEIQRDCMQRHIPWAPSPEAEEGIGATIRAAMAWAERWDACVFFAADQPRLRHSTIADFLSCCEKNGAELACVETNGVMRGSPAWFARRYFSDLASLQGDTGGRRILSQYAKEVLLYPVEQTELTDIDIPPCNAKKYPLK